MSLRVPSACAWAFILLSVGCGEPTFDEKCTQHCEETLQECGAEIGCEGCASYGGGVGCDAELEVLLDCQLELIDDFDDDDRELMCRDDGSGAVLFESCDDEVGAYTTCSDAS